MLPASKDSHPYLLTLSEISFEKKNFFGSILLMILFSLL